MPGERAASESEGPAGQSISDVIDRVLATLEAQLIVLDNLAFSIVCIHLNDAIEKLRTEQTKIRMKPKI